jgi:hypothetical protein
MDGVPGIMVLAGQSLRIPAGGLVISLDEGVSSARVELSLEVWPHWLRVAAQQTDVAIAAAAEVAAVARSAEPEPRGSAMATEMGASMVAIAAQAFAVDAVYDSIKQRLRHAPTPGKGHTVRYRWITETIRHGFRLRDDAATEVRDRLKQLFDFRDWAVHPPNDFRDPIYRADLDAAVEWRYAAFTAVNARNSLGWTLSLFDQLPKVAKDTEPEVRDWSKLIHQLLPPALAGTSIADLVGDAPRESAPES